MKRLLVLGSREFIVGAMDFSMMYAPGLSVLGVVDGASDVVEDVRQTRPDMIVLDGVTNLARAVACLPDLRAQAPDAPLIVIVDQPEPDDVARALDAGAVVCTQPPAMRSQAHDPRPDPWTAQLRSVSIPPDAVAIAPDAVLISHDAVSIPPNPVSIAPARGSRSGSGKGRQGPVLTRREHEIMEWVASGHTNARIARSLWVTEQTIKFHLTNIYRKLGVANRTEASHYVIQHGLVSATGAHNSAGAQARAATLEPVADATVVS